MHVVFVIAGARISDKEERLVRGTAQLPPVQRVTVCMVPAPQGIVATMERLRARVERAVARSDLRMVDAQTLARDGIHIRAVDWPTLGAELQAPGVSHVVNLSGRALPDVPVHVSLLELWWDGARPEGLGGSRAPARPPRDIVVTMRRAGEDVAGIVQHSRLTRTPGTEASDRRNASSRSLALLMRAFRQPRHSVAAAPWSEARQRSSTAVGPVLGAAAAMSSAIVRAIGRRSSRVLWRIDAWEIRYRTDPRHFVENAAVFTADGFRAYRGGHDRFYADPISFSHDGVDAMFFEEYPYATARGVISCARLAADGTLGTPTTVLEKPYHLSYPFVFRDGAQVFMIPEASASRTVDLYRCTQFPDQWVFERTLLADISITDATVYFDGARWWMFATVGDEGSYAWDELHLFSADSLSGEWVPHPANPVKCDAATARPAGPLFRRDGRLIRPTQDCSQSYGGAVNLCEIDVLTATEFREHPIQRLEPQAFPGTDGLHTLSATGRLEVIDVRPRWRGRWS